MPPLRIGSVGSSMNLRGMRLKVDDEGDAVVPVSLVPASLVLAVLQVE